MTTTTAPSPTAEATTATDQKVLVGLTHGPEEPENVLIAYLMGVEALRAGKEAAIWLTKEAVHVGLAGAVDDIAVDGAPSISALHDEFVGAGGRFFACPVCVNLRGLAERDWSPGVTVAGAPAVYEFTEGGALVFNY